MVRVAVLVLLATRIVAAQEVDPAGQTPGAKLFEEGRDLAKANRFAEACAKFEQSYALDNGVGTELNLADCHEHLGHMALAYRLFDEAAQRLANEPARAKFAHDRAMTLTSKLATVVVNLAEPELPGLSVTIGGRAVKARSVITEKTDPGAIAVHVATPSKTLFDGTKNAEAGATAIFNVGEVTSSSTPVGPSDNDQPEHPGSRKKLVSFTLVGVGGAAVITSVIVGVIARGNYNDATGPSSGCIKSGDTLQCPPDATKKADDAGSLADTATYIGIAGAAFVAAGVITYFAWPKEDLVVAPSVTNQSAGLAISGRF